MKNLNIILQEATHILSSHVDDPIRESYYIVEHVLGFLQEDIIMQSRIDVSLQDEKQIVHCATQRVCGMPLAYIVGYKEFYGRRFTVNQNVLIPRPETEMLVDKVLAMVHGFSSDVPLHIWDIGTGSGCIGISIAAELELHQQSREDKTCTVSLFDISTDALYVAQENAMCILDKLPLCMPLLYHWDVQLDIKSIAPFSYKNTNNINDPRIIIANLPYIPSHQYEYAKKSLKHEPRQALTGIQAINSDGLDIIRSLLQHTAQFVHKHCVLLEIDPLQFDEVLRLAKAYNYASIGIIHDLRHYPRVCFLEN